MRPLSPSWKASLEEAVKEYEKSLPLAEQYLLERGIVLSTAERFRLGVVSEPIGGHEAYVGRLAIPGIGPSGNIYSLRFRSIAGETPKYLGLSGEKVRLYNLRAVGEAEDEICITEGELDSLILESIGLNSVGVPGAEAWMRHHPRIFHQFQKVFIFGDADEAGQRFAAKVNASILSGVRVTLPSGMDVNDLFLAEGAKGIMDLMGAEE